jgi:hypothetical protein
MRGADEGNGFIKIGAVIFFSTDSVACAMGKRSEPVFVLCDQL